MESIVLNSPAGRLTVTAPAGYVLTGADWVNEGVSASVVVDGVVDRCRTCGNSEVRRYGRDEVGILDAPSGGVRARMLVARQRIDCVRCSTLSREHLPGVSEGHRFTDRAGGWMESQFGLRPNNAIAQVMGLAERTVRLYAKEVGARPGHRWRTAAAMAECSSCRRLFPATDLEIHHALPDAQAPPKENFAILCRNCHTSAAARWISPNSVE